jgi:hypothetical protein
MGLTSLFGSIVSALKAFTIQRILVDQLLTVVFLLFYLAIFELIIFTQYVRQCIAITAARGQLTDETVFAISRRRISLRLAIFTFSLVALIAPFTTTERNVLARFLTVLVAAIFLLLYIVANCGRSALLGVLECSLLNAGVLRDDPILRAATLAAITKLRLQSRYQLIGFSVWVVLLGVTASSMQIGLYLSCYVLPVVSAIEVPVCILIIHYKTIIDKGSPTKAKPRYSKSAEVPRGLSTGISAKQVMPLVGAARKPP